jgi:hypothetical protein
MNLRRYNDAAVVAFIRHVCAAELGSPRDYPFFSAGYRGGETSDEGLLRQFWAERRHHDSCLETVMVMCHG